MDKLQSYLRDNRDEIVEGWLTAVPIPDVPEADDDRAYSESALLRFLNQSMDAILTELAEDAKASDHRNELRSLLIDVPWCQGNPKARSCFCSNLWVAGISAFLKVLDDSWDTSQEFTHQERVEGAQRVREALLKVLGPSNFPCNHPAPAGETAR